MQAGLVTSLGYFSGHTQKIFQILSPRDCSFLVYQVEQKVAACHEGYYSCFFRERIEGILGNYSQSQEIFFQKRTKIVFCLLETCRRI
ncbi:phosphoribosyl-AMP cyclohydrolase domain protein [Leptospira noguchii str. 1993005606]|uniref:phosphoribosyl-AMP cyclohydrolase n=2 Tax=Leptospira noguchii TaxID=28182 RepID=M6Y4M3_9LEPT|nr:phosphoribosyl-AMP cyclohydrolase domain protein [Leptospira noguchii str. 2007001578]EMO88650.1 phosphoribosyl-AMP cyclohydrolase domain protein [Leptospira noguchii str. 2001034031]EPE84327.1 phosphoribosyl-AMP cyclohydrolase domain protein [Leptospira noguchii str. 1993005606]